MEGSEQFDKKSRVIIRNLVFDTNQNMLQKLFKPFGKVVDINIPINPTNNKPKGFAFVQFENKNEADRAIKQLNETKWKGRTVLLDFSVDIRQYQLFKQQLQDNQNNDDNPKSQFEKEAMDIENEENKDKEEINDQQEKKSQISRKSSKESQIEQKRKSSKESAIQEKPKLKRYDDSDMSDTIFVRSIPYDTKEEQFIQFFRKFGEVIYAKLCMNKQTQTPNGTGFVKFQDKSVAARLQAFKPPVKKNPKQKTVNELEMNGRLLVCLPALQRGNIPVKEGFIIYVDKSEKKKVDIKKINKLDDLINTDSQNKRNLYLAKIGSFQPTEVKFLKKDMNDFEYQKFEAHYKEKIQKLKNPNHFVSKERVLIKNIPKKNFDEEDLKQILSKFKETQDKSHKKLVKQTKFLLDKDKIDKETGSPMNKGICFIDFEEHDKALKFIQYIIDNSKKLLKSRPLIEFALEDSRFQKKRNDIKEKKKEQEGDEQMQKLKPSKDLKEQTKNSSQASLILLKQKLEQKADHQTIKDLVYQIKIRGIRQRAKKMIRRELQQDIFQQQTQQRKVSNEKDKVKNDKIEQIKKQKEEQKETQQKQQIIQSKKREQKKQEELKERKQMNKIKTQVKNKQDLKKRKNDEDEFDAFAANYAAKLEKKLKWDSKGDEALIL